MEIGNPVKKYVIEPVREPIPQKETQDEPIEQPELEPAEPVFTDR